MLCFRPNSTGSIPVTHSKIYNRSLLGNRKGGLEKCPVDSFPDAARRFPLPTPRYITAPFKGIEKNIKSKKATEVSYSFLAFLF